MYAGKCKNILGRLIDKLHTYLPGCQLSSIKKNSLQNGSILRLFLGWMNKFIGLKRGVQIKQMNPFSI